MAYKVTCPSCGNRTFRSKGGYCQCSQCNLVGWEWNRSPDGETEEAGLTCPDCGYNDFRRVVTVDFRFSLYRCSACMYTLMKPSE
ncbi:hypothetical protein GTO89_11610 [Heliobacterium gestii]|uniref:Uncharacterized protein n=1 Tax=Heliomicrobium gestii TaxID=2699 RepID=A0A845LBY4_HELGE|nr:hypothetical protein [Heliomicrobium gestii]MBM7867424.1 ribosomal protein L37AE/L43A [Heliomicrobium gestii]MZP43688.1 hypothetical protein [Heliomicrobium gestii]